MRFDIAHRDRNQKGAVLIVSLIMLAVMTLFVISMLKTSILELKIGGASQAAALNFANAELAINNFITINTGRFAPGFLTIPGVADNTPPSVYGGQVQVIPTQVSCGPAPGTNFMQAGALDIAHFDLRAVATDSFNGTTTLVQGVWSYAPAGGCL